MSENFNPYAQWLGIPAETTAPNYYQLLGIDQSVADPAAIASAADRALTRVRACKPGPHAAAWAQLLDRISTAKGVLTNPMQRQSYDQQLSTQTTTAGPANPTLLPPSNKPTHPLIAAQPTATAIDPMSPMAHFAMSPRPVAPQAPQPTPSDLPPQSPWVAVAAPNPMAPVPVAVPLPAANGSQGPSDPMAPLVPAVPYAQAIPITPSPMAPLQAVSLPATAPTSVPAVPFGVPTEAPAASGMWASAPSAPAPKFDDVPKLKRKPTAQARARSRSNGLLGPILLGGSLVGLILVVVGVGFYLVGSPPNRSSQPVAEVTPQSPSTPTGEVASSIPRRLDEMPESERPRPTVLIPPARDAMPAEPAMSPITEPAPPMTPTSVTPPSATPVPEPMPDSGPSREELRALAQALTTARAALGELNFPVAEREMTKAQALATLDDHQAKVRRLQLLREYLERFHKAIGETLGRVNAGDQIDLGEGKSFGIVEKTPDLLIIRVNGRNLRYPMTELHPGLAVRLAEMSLDKASPDTTAMKAAYVSINPKIDDNDRKKVDDWWKEAASVKDVPDLIAAINDDYGLKQDVMAVPLEPKAMAELTARADRLQGAGTIEEFAKEFQEAIDESLKTLEPEMELSVGGSTTITIKELKADRLMVVVADETRGFQYAKLPLGLAAALAERILPRDAPLTMVMKGAYFAAREKEQSNKQFRPLVLDWWKQSGEMDPQLQTVIRELAKQYPE